MNNLDEYFAQARSRPRAIPAERIGQLLDDGMAATGESLPVATPKTHRGRIMMMTAAIVATITGISIFFTGTPEYRPAPARTAAPAIAAPAGALKQENGVSNPIGHEDEIHLASPGRSGLPGAPMVAGIPRHREDRDTGQGKSGKPQAMTPVDISGVKLIELTPEEMAHLGAKADSAGVLIFVAQGLSSSVTEYSMYGTRLDPEHITAKSMGVTPLLAPPTLVTDDHGAWRAMSFDNDMIDSALSARINALPVDSPERYNLQMELMRKGEETVAKSVNTLMPIIVRTGHPYTKADSLNGRWRPDCILWIRPTPELLADLPEPIRTKIEKELIAAHKLDDSTLHAIAAVPSVTGEQPYLDILRTTSGAILNTALFPNPARDRATLHYRLAQSRTISVTLHDIRGAKIRQLIAEHPVGEGEESIDIDLGTLPAGVYLISISSNKGERAIQRLVVAQH
ncbi:MAG: T9SS type A sorting domain-containing protein [Bacteroidota bacterium]